MLRLIHLLTYIVIIAISAQLTIDLNLPNVTIPISGQTLAILTGAVFLKPLESFISICIYLLVGIMGLPVFSDGGAGSAIFVSYMTEKGKTESILQLFLVMAIGTLIILILGSLNLAREHGLQKGLEYGFTPFLLGGIIKVIIGVGLVTVFRRLIK